MLKIVSAHIRFKDIDLPQLKERLGTKAVEWVDSEEQVTERRLLWLLATFSNNHQLLYSISHRCVFIKNDIEAFKFTTINGVCDHVEKILTDDSFKQLLTNQLNALQVSSAATPTSIKHNGSCLMAVDFDNGSDLMWTTETWTALVPFNKRH